MVPFKTHQIENMFDEASRCARNLGLEEVTEKQLMLYGFKRNGTEVYFNKYGNISVAYCRDKKTGDYRWLGMMYLP
jgi:hypothetical protein